MGNVRMDHLERDSSEHQQITLVVNEISCLALSASSASEQADNTAHRPLSYGSACPIELKGSIQVEDSFSAEVL